MAPWWVSERKPLSKREARKEREAEEQARRDQEYFKEVLVMAREDMDRAYELWWAGMKKIAPWAVKETSDEERRVGFRRATKFCLKHNTGANITYAPNIQAVLGELTRK